MLALAAGRKIRILGMIHDLHFKLDLLTRKRMNLASTGMLIADNCISQQETQNANYYVQNGLSGIIGMGQQMNQNESVSQGQQMVFKKFDTDTNIYIHEKVKEQAQYQLAQQEKRLDMEAKRIETKLSTLEKEYDAVVKQEEYAVKIATPRYVA